MRVLKVKLSNFYDIPRVQTINVTGAIWLACNTTFVSLSLRRRGS
jgi:hypothetical protein